ncbi:hypothetical protein [Streptomyces sp. NPDC086989]|uniref:hypothetical protein n=1 Tax=Streptomyces sp. NPDC086989 TaxID=3365764 RepID=UPI0037FAA8DD
MRRPGLVGAVVGVVALLGGCSGVGGGRDVRDAPHWEEGATVVSVAQTLQVQVPATATDARAARHKGFQDDGLILAFVLPTDEVDGFLDRLRPERPLRLGEKPWAGEGEPATPFAHLGLPEPESLANVREGQVCAPCKDELDWLKVAVARADDRSSRVYLHGVD